MPTKKKVAKAATSLRIQPAKPYGSKSALVRGLPMDLPARGVVAKAAELGMKLSIAQVYNIRSTTKRKAGTPRASRGTAPQAARVSQSSEAEGRLRKLIAEVGLTRARAVMAEVLAAFA